MVVRFDSNLIRDVVERRSDPIGVEGDPLSQVKGGISEADKIVESARRRLENADSTSLESGSSSKPENETQTGAKAVASPTSREDVVHSG